MSITAIPIYKYIMCGWILYGGVQAMGGVWTRSTKERRRVSFAANIGILYVHKYEGSSYKQIHARVPYNGGGGGVWEGERHDIDGSTDDMFYMWIDVRN